MAEEFLKDHGCSCCNGHHDEDEGIKLNEVGTCSCGCGDDEDDEEESPLWTLIAGTVLFLITYLTNIIPEAVSLPAYIIAYLLLGYGVLREAGENIMKRRPFDENFLMAVATIGAFAIGDYPEAVAVMLFSRIGEAMEDRAVHRSRKQVAAAIDMRPEVVHRLGADGSTVTIPAKEAIAGDVVVVRVGDRIPLDGIVTAGESLIDTSALTGEPVPVICREGAEVLSGSINTTGVLQVKVTKPLAESMVTKILESVERAAARKPKIDRFITRFSRIYTPAVVAIAAATAIVPSLVTGQWHYWIYTALTFLVISCPCALVLSVPLSFFAGIGAASKQGILFKGGSVQILLRDDDHRLAQRNIPERKALFPGRRHQANLAVLKAQKLALKPPALVYRSIQMHFHRIAHMPVKVRLLFERTINTRRTYLEEVVIHALH